MKVELTDSFNLVAACMTLVWNFILVLYIPSNCLFELHFCSLCPLDSASNSVFFVYFCLQAVFECVDNMIKLAQYVIEILMW